MNDALKRKQERALSSPGDQKPSNKEKVLRTDISSLELLQTVDLMDRKAIENAVFVQDPKKEKTSKKICKETCQTEKEPETVFKEKKVN